MGAVVPGLTYKVNWVGGIVYSRLTGNPVLEYGGKSSEGEIVTKGAVGVDDDGDPGLSQGYCYKLPGRPPSGQGLIDCGQTNAVTL